MYLKKNYLLLPAVFTGVYIENRSFYTEKTGMTVVGHPCSELV